MPSMRNPHSDFLLNIANYLECERFWSRTIDEWSSSLGQGGEWKPWLATSTGTSGSRILMDGNPIANARSDRLNRAFRIIQHQSFGEELRFAWWTEHESEFPELPRDELVISLILSDETMALTKASVISWMDQDADLEAIDNTIRGILANLEVGLTQAAKLGNANDMTKLASLILSSNPERLPEAESWFRKAAEKGNPEAICQLGRLLAEKAQEDPTKLTEATRWLRDASREGHPETMFQLGSLMERLAEADPERLFEAERWYTGAAEAGHRRAMFKLSQLLRSQANLDPSKSAEASRWYERWEGLT